MPAAGEHVLPHASAGAIFHAGIAIGKFHGVIAATMPTGSREISTSTPGRVESTFSPPGRRASPAKNLKMDPARAASPMPSARGLPCSRESSRPSSSLRARISVPARSRTSKRSCGVDCDHFFSAVFAAAIARSRSATEAAANSPTTSFRSEGLMSGVRSGSRSTGRRLNSECRAYRSMCHQRPGLQSRPRGRSFQWVAHRRKVFRAVATVRA